MQRLLKTLTEQGLLHEWEDTDFDLPYLLRAVALMRHGALAAGLLCCIMDLPGIAESNSLKLQSRFPCYCR